MSWELSEETDALMSLLETTTLKKESAGFFENIMSSLPRRQSFS
jgi:hypothetical protein